MKDILTGKTEQPRFNDQNPISAFMAIVNEHQELFQPEDIGAIGQNLNKFKNYIKSAQSSVLSGNSLVDIEIQRVCPDIDNVLLFLKALKAIPEDTANLQEYISSLPTIEDGIKEGNLRRQDNSYFSLQTKIDGVSFVATKYDGQFSYALSFNEDATKRVSSSVIPE